MPQINVAGHEVDVDIRTELEVFPWTRPRWSSDKLIAASPMRYDHTPSFFVNLDGEYAGTWGDSGSYSEDWESGNLVKLLSFLRDETYEETVDYLLATYAPFQFGDEQTELKLPQLRLRTRKERVVLPEDLYTPQASAYLRNRGISDKVQRYLGVGLTDYKDAVILPWRHADGSLANVKFRKVRGKAFYYRKGAEPVRNLVFGINIVYKRELPTVYICEAEIDALSVMSAGLPAVALGGASVSRRQLELLRKAPVEQWIIATDNDKAGEKLRRQLAEGLSGYGRIGDVYMPAPYKDANEAHVAGVALSELSVEWRVGLRLSN